MSDLNIVSSNVGNCKKFNCSQHVFEINFQESNSTFGESNTKINELFSNIHIKTVELMNDGDYARIIFIHDDLDHPIGYPFMNKETLLTTNLQTTFDSAIQSYKTITMNKNNSFKAVVVIAHLPSGSNGNYDNQQEYLSDSQNYITVINADNRCGVRAVILAVAFYNSKLTKDKTDIRYFNNLNRLHSTLLEREVTKISTICNIKDRPCGISEFQKLEVYFKDYQIVLVNNDGKLDKIPLFKGIENKYTIYICYTGSYFNVIKKINLFYKCKYYCNKCSVEYNISDNFCKNNCRYCNRQNCILRNQTTTKHNVNFAT